MLERQSKFAIAGSLLWILFAAAAVFGTHRPAESAGVSATDALELPRVEVRIEFSEAAAITEPTALPTVAPSPDGSATARC